jgi:APA family basic amino acid/polyamine antiporter
MNEEYVESAPAVSPFRGVQKDKLLRILGVGFGIAVVIGGMIGIGILRNPGTVAAHVGKPWLILSIWALGGLFTLLGANYMAELATMLPKAGGPYVYARRAYGDYPGFVVGWSDWFINTASIAFFGIAIGEYVPALVPSFAHSITVIAVTILFFFFLVNLIGLRSGSGAQKLTSFLKTLGLLALVVGCFAFGGRHSSPESATATRALPSTFATLFIAMMLAFQSVFVTYAGWNTVVYFAEEDKNPERNLPRSLFGGVLLVIFIYLLVNAALLYVVPIPRMAGSKLPVADAAQLIFGAHSGQIVSALAIVSLFSIINVSFLQTSRTLFALSRDGLFSNKGALVNAGGTPTVALIVTAFVAILLAATGTFDQLLAIYAFLGVVIEIFVVASLFVLRRREPDLTRPFKAWGYPWTPSLLLLIDIALFVGFIIGDMTNSLYALILLALSYPGYLIVKKMVRS